MPDDPDQPDDTAYRHLCICRSFGDEVDRVGRHWHSLSPCSEWDARGVLEHVIGFHDVLLLGPMGVKPQRPRNDPVGRWAATVEALDSLLNRPGLFDGTVEVPGLGTRPPSRIDAARLVPLLSLDVLVHTWDLARAAGHEVVLDPESCRLFLDGLPSDFTVLSRTGLYDVPRVVPADADAQNKLLARLGRDPGWSGPPDRHRS
ncbi:MAG: hypothetical protein ABSC90_05890 [Acidimicrobiales bacterium]|jgi:uncharacterized protein (TIGR03086 family)